MPGPIPGSQYYDVNQLEVGCQCGPTVTGTVHFMVDALSVVSNLHNQKVEDLLNIGFIYFFLFYVTEQFQCIHPFY